MANYSDKRFPVPPQDPCTPPVRSRQTLSGPQISYVTIQNNGPNAQGDVLLQPSFPFNSIFIVSRKGGTEASSCFFHFAKLNKNYTAAAITQTGFEQWIGMNTNPASGPNYLTVIRFKEKVLTAFVDVGFEGGAGPITFACVADDDVEVTGGLYT